MTERKMQLEDWLDDLCVRFIINLPQEDLSTVARICFQVEEAQWFYEDFIRPLDPTLPSMTLRSFCLRIFQHCPLLAPFSVENHMRAFEEFLQYKTRVPVRGAILLNEAMDSTVLVKGWKKGANWSFPRGKINKDEDDLECAIREVYEETGFDIRAAGLVPERDEVKYIEVTMREQQLRLYVFRNIPMETHFEPKTRKEISKIQWYKLSELPAFRKKGNQQQNDAAAASNANKFYMVAPFLVPLKKWVVQQKKKDAARNPHHGHLFAQPLNEEPVTEEESGLQPELLSESSRITPAIDTLEGATRELQRLLKVQPPTQGLQVGSTAQNSDKGGALMALLQAKGGEPAQQPPQVNSQVPHTPFDLTYTHAPEPHTPHHHHPSQRLPFSSYQAPPSFPIPPNMNQNFAGSYGPAPNVPPQMMPENQYPNQHAAYMVPPQHQREPIQLLHPQPLPPQVPNGLLTKGFVPTPAVPEERSNVPELAGQHVRTQYDTMQVMQQNYVAASRAPQHQRNPQAAELLNIFKQAGNHTSETHTHVTAQAQPSAEDDRQAPPVNWAPLTSTYGPQHGSNPTRPTNITSQQMPSNGSSQFAGAQAPLRQPQTTEKQKSALLDIFKQQGPAPETHQRHTSSQNPTISQPQQVASRYVSRNPNVENVITSAQVGGGPGQVNPDLNLPFGALSILSRSKNPNDQLSNEPSPMQQPQTALSRSSELPAPASKPLEIIGSSHVPLASHPNLSPYQTQAYHGLPSPQAGSSFSGSGGVQRRQDANPEQRQKLLSLFGKQQASPTGSFFDDKGKVKDQSVYEQGHSGTPRSRVASLASASGDGASGGASRSRRGSQTPISPAERSFLLGILESVSNSAR